MKNSPFILRLPNKLLASAQIKNEISGHAAIAIPYAHAQSISHKQAEIIRQSYSGLHFFLELSYSNIKKPINIKLQVKKYQLTFLYVIKSSAYRLVQDAPIVPVVPSHHYTAFCLPKGKYQLHLEEGEHIFLYFSLKKAYLTMVSALHPHLEALARRISTTENKPTLFALRKIDFPIKKLIKKLQLCKAEGPSLDPLLLSYLLEMASIYGSQLSREGHRYYASATELVHEAYSWMRVRAIQAPLLTIDEVASRYHITPDNLSRIFREYMGISPQQFITEVRMKEARVLLSEKKLLVKSVSEKLGYSESSTFSKQFKTYFGYPPGRIPEKPKG